MGEQEEAPKVPGTIRARKFELVDEHDRVRAALSRNRATRLERRGKGAAAASSRRRAGESDRQAQVLRDLLAAPPRDIESEPQGPDAEKGQ